MNIRVRLALMLTYFLFAILLNSVGTVILQSIATFGADKIAASKLEMYKDLPIAVVSFLVASSLPRFGYRRALIAGLLIVTTGALAMRFLESFAATKLLFLMTGSAFALVKVSVYASVGLLTEDRQRHASLLNLIEGVFMIGMFSGYFLFALFIRDNAPGATGWLDVYWVLAGLSLLAALLLVFTPFPEQEGAAHGSGEAQRGGLADLAESFGAMLRLCLLPLVQVFVLSAFLYVLLEQGIGTWLPTFNSEVLHLPEAMSVMAASIFSGGIALGRLSAGVILRRVNWYIVVNLCVLAMAALLLLSMPLTRGLVPLEDVTWLSAPLAVWIVPLIGLFMAPIYPVINSVMLTALPQERHAAMTGLIVVFSALGGTTGSRVVGEVFARTSGQTAFTATLVPMAAILVTLWFFRRQSQRRIDA